MLIDPLDGYGDKEPFYDTVTLGMLTLSHLVTDARNNVVLLDIR